jgi:hypothetical protein
MHEEEEEEQLAPKPPSSQPSLPEEGLAKE